VSVLPITTHRPRSDWAVNIRQSWCHFYFLGSEIHLTAVPEGMCHSSTRPSNVQVHHCTWSVLPGLPRVSTASDKHCGEKAWLQG